MLEANKLNIHDVDASALRQSFRDGLSPEDAVKSFLTPNYEDTRPLRKAPLWDVSKYREPKRKLIQRWKETERRWAEEDKRREEQEHLSREWQERVDAAEKQLHDQMEEELNNFELEQNPGESDSDFEARFDTAYRTIENKYFDKMEAVRDKVSEHMDRDRYGYSPDEEATNYGYASITQKLLNKYSETDADILSRYPEANVEHKCPAVVDGWSSIEDCLPDCKYKKSMNEDDYWRDIDWERQPPPTKEEILSKLPSGKHSKYMRDVVTMPEDEWETKLLQQQDEEDLMKMSPKDRKHY